MPLCFDLDGTLGRFEGGYKILRQALGVLWGEEPSAADLASCKGSTDWEIVGELHWNRFGRVFTPEDFWRYEAECLRRFQQAFGPGQAMPDIFQGPVEGVNALHRQGFLVQLVSGNTPRILAFKACCLGLRESIPLFGSEPGLDRGGILRASLRSAPEPHLYVGDRPHDYEAALSAGIPFLGVGPFIPQGLDTAVTSRDFQSAVLTAAHAMSYRSQP